MYNLEYHYYIFERAYQNIIKQIFDFSSDFHRPMDKNARDELASWKKTEVRKQFHDLSQRCLSKQKKKATRGVERRSLQNDK